jgi:hypothetical protein
MAVSYIINHRSPLPQNIFQKTDMAYIFTDGDELLKSFLVRNIHTLALTKNGEKVRTNIPQPASYYNKSHLVSNYLFWRKFMILYHFRSVRLTTRKKRPLTYLEPLVRPAKQFTISNRDYKQAFKGFNAIDADIRTAVSSLLKNDYEDYEIFRNGVESILSIFIQMFNSYMDHLGYPRYFSTLQQSSAYYLAITLIYDYELCYTDIKENGTLRPKLLKIISRMFNESIVHKKRKVWDKKLNDLHKTLELVHAEEYTHETYLNVIKG